MGLDAELGAGMVAALPSLRRYARALAGERVRADDLVQDCLERAWRRRHLFRAGADARVWLLSILHNVYVSGVRRAARRPREVELDERRVPGTAGAGEASAELERVDRALAELPAEQRAAVVLVAVEDLSYAEAAAVLAIPVGTLMSRLHRGRRRLHERVRGVGAAPLRRVK